MDTRRGDAGRIRPIDPESAAEIALVAQRMRLTLMEVLGAATGRSLYTMAWLTRRLRWHLDPAQCTGQVFLAETEDGRIAGHTIVRLDVADDGGPIGLFSTTYVDPAFRRQGIADRLIETGEAWLRDQGRTILVTDTSATNRKLIGLFHKHGYAIVHEADTMVRLGKTVPPA